MTDLDASDELLNRAATSGLGAAAQDLLVAAVVGPDALDATIGGAGRPVIEAGSSESSISNAAIYLAGIEASGFRGIGPAARLGLKPIPGLSLVVGRNGAGKSSFVDAAEVALTRTTSRWSGKGARVWKEGWANVHDGATRAVELKLQFEGEDGQTVVRHEWPASATSADEGTAFAQRPGGQREPLAALGLDTALGSFRPILSYNELGGLLESGPSVLFDAISSGLGLEEYVVVQARLDDARKELDREIKFSDSQLSQLRRELQALDDERAEAVLDALAPRKTWDLNAVEQLVTGVATPSGEVAGLQALVALPMVDVHAVESRAAAVRAAVIATSEMANTEAGRASELAELLEQALAVHGHEPGENCPVCGTAGILDAEWVARTEAQVATLRADARAATNAAASLADSLRALRGAISNPPAALRGTVEGIDLAPPLSQWIAWADTRDGQGEPNELANVLEAGARDLAEALEQVRSVARLELERRADVWQPVASQVQAWIPGARRAATTKPLIAELKAAATWVADDANSLRNERFAPIRERVLEIWNTMRQTSSVSLDEVVLTGKGTRRSVDLQVSVDGEKSAALAVMSQGEQNTLALSLFLPRAAMTTSPFRFMLIDDPVQSMDAARVDGLARVLAKVATTHQVVVFTHDERLPEACRRLDLGATVFEVSRSEHSNVNVRRKNHPVDDYLADARAVLKSEAPSAAKQRVIPGLCRSAIEAACVEKTRHTLISGGSPHADVDALLERAMTTNAKIGLALFGDLDHGGDVLATVNRKFGPAAADVMQVLKKGAHEEVERDPEGLIGATKVLAEALRDLK